MPYTDTFRDSSRARRGEIFALANFRGMREPAEICPTRAFRLQKEVNLHFWRSFAHRTKFQILTSEFLKYWRIEAELVQQWYSISPTLLTFEFFEIWVFPNFEKRFKIKYRKVELIPPILKIFDLTTCSFYCEIKSYLPPFCKIAKSRNQSCDFTVKTTRSESNFSTVPTVEIQPTTCSFHVSAFVLEMCPCRTHFESQKLRNCVFAL